jgi:hypothetical protein
MERQSPRDKKAAFHALMILDTSYTLRYAEATQDGKADEQEKEGRQCREPEPIRRKPGTPRSPCVA